jgi:hypothetical protein
MTKKILLLFSIRVLSHKEFEYFVDSKTERTKVSLQEFTKNHLMSRLVLLNGILRSNVIKEDPNYASELLQKATQGYEVMLNRREQTLRDMSPNSVKELYQRLEKFILAEKELQYAIFMQLDSITPNLRPLLFHQVPQNVW